MSKDARKTARRAARARPALPALLAAALLAAGPARGGTPALRPPVFELENGFRFAVDHAPGTGVVSAGVWIGAGSIHEREEEAGIAHLLEHMLFRGTANLAPGAAERRIEELGGRLNAATSFEFTSCYFSIGAESFAEALGIVAELVRRPALESGELEKEIQVVLREVDQREDEPSGRSARLFYQALYPDHPYGRPIIGHRETVSALDREALRAFHERFYTPDNMFLAVSGDADPETVRALAEKHFADMPRSRTGPPAPAPTAGPGPDKTLTESADIAGAYLWLGWTGPTPDRAAELAALDLGFTVLGGGRSSRLYRSLRDEQGLVSSVSAGVATLSAGGPAAVRAVFEPGREAEVTAAVTAELRAFLESGPSGEELERARAMIESGLLFSLETTLNRVSLFGRYGSAGRLDFVAGYLERLAALEAADVLEAMRTRVDPERFTAALLAPARPEAAEADDRAEPPGPEAAPLVRRLANGVTMVLEENPRVDIIALSVFAAGGQRLEEERNHGIGAFAGRMAARGADGLRAEEIAERFDALGARFGIETAPDYAVASLQAPGRRFGEAFDLFTRLLARPEFPPGELERERAQALNEIARRRDNLFSHGYDLFREAFYSEHPYRFPSQGSAETIAALGREEIAAFHARAWRPEKMTVAAAGNFRAAEMAGRLAEFFGALEPGAGPRPETDPPAREAPAEEVLIRSGRETRTAWVLVGYPAPPADSPDYPAVKTLKAVLGAGMGSRLFARVRDEQALAYSVGAFYPTRAGESHLVLYAATEPDKADETIASLRAEAGRLAAEEPSGEELSRARRYLAGRHRLAQETRAARAHYLGWFELLGAGWRFADGYPEELAGVDGKAVREAAARYLSEPPVIVVVGPDDGAGAP